MGVSVLRDQALQPCPQGIRHTKVGRHLVHGGARASLSHLYHDLTLSHPGYPDRLLAHGADVNAKDHDGMTPLHTAVEKSFVVVMELLLNHGADVNARMRHDGMIALLFAVMGYYDAKDKAALLLNHGADVNMS